MQIDITGDLSLETLARLAFYQARRGITCRFLAPDNSWEVATDNLGGKTAGVITVTCQDDKLQWATAHALRDLGDISVDTRLFAPIGKRFIVRPH